MPGLRQVEVMQGPHGSCTGKHRDRVRGTAGGLEKGGG